METLTSAILLAEDQALSIPSGIWTESLPGALLGRVGWSCGSEVSLKQSIADLEHLPEVAPHLLESQTRKDADAPKAMDQLRSDGDGRQRIALLKSDQPTKSKTYCHLSLRLKCYDARVNREEALFRVQPERVLDKAIQDERPINSYERIPPLIIVEPGQRRPHLWRRGMQDRFILY